MRRKDPGGQSLASKEGFEASSGEYVVFLDADDYLLASFVETHVFVHLSLRVPVGFSSSDMIQAVDSRMVLGTIAYLSQYVRSGRGKSPGLVRRIDKSAPEVWPLPSPDASIETEVHFVKPGYAGDWMWAPTSGNCFRRDALQLFLNNEDLAALLTGTDAYLIRGVNVVTGNVVIDRPLGVYRLHGMNEFSKHPHLNGVLNYERNSPSDPNQLGRKMIIDHLIANAQLFVRKMPSPWALYERVKGRGRPLAAASFDGRGLPLLSCWQACGGSRHARTWLGLFIFIAFSLIRLKVAPHVILRAWLNYKRAKRS